MAHGKQLHLTREILLEAIKDSRGVIATVAKRLDVNWQTAKKYANKWEETREALNDEVQTFNDTCEEAIYNSVKDGNTHDAKWVLAHKAKDRGWGDVMEVHGDLTYTVVPAKPPESEDAED